MDNSINLMSTLRVCMNEEMMLPSSLIIWFEGSSSGPSHSHFSFFILTRSLNELMTPWFVRLMRDQRSSLHSKLKRVEGVSSAGSWIPL